MNERILKSVQIWSFDRVATIRV